ncbi:MAG: hypothetical protein ACRD2N_16330 [Vicinamibacterales bacterium]
MTIFPSRQSPVRLGLELVGSVLLVWAATSYLLLFMHRGANLLDEGSQVAMANRILHGEVIYRDFLAVATPGSFYTVAILFQLFGTDLMVLRWAVFALSLGILIVTLIIARHLMSWPFAAASALLTIVWGWFLVAPNLYSWQAMFLALCALLCYLRYARTYRRSWLVAAGIACGAAICFKQNTGIYATTGLLLCLWLSRVFETGQIWDPWRERWYGTRFFLKGVALVVFSMLLCLIYLGAAAHLYENWFYYPIQLYPEGLRVDYPAFYPLVAKPGFETLRQVLPDLVTERIAQPAGWEIWQKFVLYLPWLVYPFTLVALCVLLVRKVNDDNALTALEGHSLLAVTSFGALTFLQAWPRADVTHILFGMQPAFVLLGYLCYSCWRIARNRFSALTSTAVLVLLLLPYALLIRNGYKYTEYGFQNEYVPIRAARAGGVRTSVRNAAQIDRVTEYITTHTAPGDPIFVVPWAAGFYFLTGRPNPTRFDVLLYGDPDQYPCLIATLDQRRPKYVIYGYGWDVDGKRFREYAQPIDEYVRTRYRIAERVDEYEIWRRLDNTEAVYRDTTGACRRRMFNAREFGRLLRQIFWGGR